MNILFTLCGRAGSKGVAGKNVRPFLDVPLAWLTLAAMEAYRTSDEGQKHHIDITLSTDSDLLIDIVNSAPIKGVNIIHRTAELSGDRVRKVDVIRDALDLTEQATSRRYDMVVDLDNTSPLRRVKDIAAAIDRKNARKEADVVFSVTPSRRLPVFNMVMQQPDGFYGVVMPSGYASRQQAPAFYDINGSIYAYSPEALRHKDPAVMFDSACDVVVMSDTAVIDIDNEGDYELMQVIARHLYSQQTDYAAIYHLAQSWKKV